MSHRLLHLLCVSQNASQVYLTLLKLYGTDEQEEPVPVRPADCVEWHVRYKKKKKRNSRFATLGSYAAAHSLCLQVGTPLC